MPQRMIRSILVLSFLALASATISLAQPSTSNVESPVRSPINSWQGAQLEGSSKGKLFVVTIDQPNRRQTCHIRSFTMEKLVCSRAIGGHRTFLPQQTLALILPGDGALRLRVLLGLNAGLGTAIWGTVVFAAVCPGCAVATGIAALVFFAAAGTVLFTDDQPDRFLYLAPRQQLTSKLRFVQP